MYPITTDTAIDDEFTDGDESQSIPPTDLNALWFNTIQRELLNILDGMDVAPDPADFAQIWDILKRIGFRCNYYTGDVETDSFDGHQVILHSCVDFQLDALKTNSIVVVIPYWSADTDPAKITVSYKNSSNKYDIPKGSILVGLVKNGVSPFSQIVPRYIPFMYSGKNLNVGDVAAERVVAQKRFESGFVVFEYSDEVGTSGLEAWREWQLAENWEVGQVKRVWCNNANSAGTGVYVYYDANGNYKQVKFYPESFREFVCVGTYVATINDTAYTFAVLVVNGPKN